MVLLLLFCVGFYGWWRAEDIKQKVFPWLLEDQRAKTSRKPDNTTIRFREAPVILCFHLNPVELHLFLINPVEFYVINRQFTGISSSKSF